METFVGMTASTAPIIFCVAHTLIHEFMGCAFAFGFDETLHAWHGNRTGPGDR